MGKHARQQNCGGCNGRGVERQYQDGSFREVPCKLCNGTGRQP